MEDFDPTITIQGDTLTFELVTTIQRPVEEVFAFLANGENNPKWELEIVDARQLTEGPPRVGTRWSYVRRFPGTHMCLVSWIRPQWTDYSRRWQCVCGAQSDARWRSGLLV